MNITFDVKAALMLGFAFGLFAVQHYSNYYVLYAAIGIFAFYTAVETFMKDVVQRHMLLYAPEEKPERLEHDKRRSLTYPDILTNSWYHLCDDDEVVPGKVMEVRALGLTFILWRTDEGKVVCQDAFCIHLGANLGVGGKVKDNCVVCPFHRWKFGEDGSVKEVPYLDDPKSCHTHKKLKTYHCVEWCGLICVYYHADDEEPEFPLPQFIPDELKRDDWMPHLKWNIGFKTLSPVDWVDQAGDHSHFHTLHADFLLPWTTIPIPEWLLKIFPIGIKHKLATYIGDDKEWIEKVEKTGWGAVNKRYIFFTDYVGLSWNGELIPSTVAETLEMFIGTAIMSFHIPFTIGIVKVFVTTTPCEGGSIMKVRTWVDSRVKYSYWKKYLAWVLTGISASQLYADMIIMCNKIRLRKPVLQPYDGPYNRTNGWIKNFYSKSSGNVSQGGPCVGYKNDW